MKPAVVFLILLLTSPIVKAKECEREAKKSGWGVKSIIGVTVGVVGAVVAAPVVITAAGFTSAGIAAGSVAAGMMSATGPVAAGGVVATLQSVGAAGFGVAGNAVLGAAGAAVGKKIADVYDEE